jgi:hypothetical protein
VKDDELIFWKHALYIAGIGLTFFKSFVAAAKEAITVGDKGMKVLTKWIKYFKKKP